MRRFRSLSGASPRLHPGGGRSSILAGALSALVACWWLSARRQPSRTSAAVPPPAELAAGSEGELAPPEARLGRMAGAVSSPERIPAARAGAVALVDVRGRVLAGGLAVAEQEIELVPLAASAARSAWDLTDEEGHYAVRLAPGRYGMLLDGVPVPGVYLDVVSGAPQVHSDLMLANVAPAD